MCVPVGTVNTQPHQKGCTLLFAGEDRGEERGFPSLFCFKSALVGLKMLTLCVCVCISAGSDRGAYGRSHLPLTVPLFWQAQACFSQSRFSCSHSFTSWAPGLLAFSSLLACVSFVAFWLIGHCFNYYCTKETCIFYLSFCCLSDCGLQAANTELKLLRSGVNCSGFLGVSLLYISLGEEKALLNSFFFALSQTLWSALSGAVAKKPWLLFSSTAWTQTVGMFCGHTFPWFEPFCCHLSYLSLYSFCTNSLFFHFAVSNSPQKSETFGLCVKIKQWMHRHALKSVILPPFLSIQAHYSSR